MKAIFKTLITGMMTTGFLSLVLRLYMGGIFIYASMYKINYPGEFAETIAGYQIVPYWGVNLMAVILPWVELVCGILLVIGVRTRAAAASIIGMLSAFSIAIAVNLIRGVPIGCGCFHTVEEPMTWVTLLRDIVWISMTLFVYHYESVFQLEKKFLLPAAEI